MIKIVHNFFLAGDKFMLNLNLRQSKFTYSACGPFAKHHERIQKLRETGNLKHIYKNELGKSCFAHDAAYSGSKGLAKKAISDEILKDRACEIAVNPKYDRYQAGLASMVYKFYDQGAGLRASVYEELA